MPKTQNKHNIAPRRDVNPDLARMQRRIVLQAGMALSAIALTIVMIFAMTAAWYTNIVHTSGLTFEVETWGFNGVITSNNDPIVAGPGDEGIIELEVDSDSNSASAVSVSFSKAQMPKMMQQRIYFYADTSMVRNGEVMDRVYLNSRESYTYNLFSQGKLTLTERVHNAAQLKWHWVYDVLGYYVEGMRLSDDYDVQVIDYLRPIEYDYDTATMSYDTTKGVYVMETVDGSMTMEQFLVELSRKDGYQGVIDTTQKLGSGYYPVDVDEDGYGVYAYLCSYEEIQVNTGNDTALGQGDLVLESPNTAKILVSAQKSKNTVINVTSLAGLNSAIQLGAADTIQLTSDVVIGTDEVLTVPEGQRVMLDLNGHELISTDPDTIPVRVDEGGSLTMVNGSLEYQNDGTVNENYAVMVIGAELVMSNVDVSGYESGLAVRDNYGTKSQDSTVQLVGCDWTTKGCTLLAFGNGTKSAQKTHVVIEDCNLTSTENYVICGSGNAESAGTDIQVINSTLTSAADVISSAIYHPQKDSVLTIYSSAVSGYTGIAIKGGTVNILGSTVEGLGNGIDVIETFSNSGFNDTGDAVYIETNYGYPIELNISDLDAVAGNAVTTPQTVLSSTSRYALRVHDPEAANVSVNIVSGSFNRVPNGDKFATYLDPESVLNVDGTQYVVTLKPEQTQG